MPGNPSLQDVDVLSTFSAGFGLNVRPDAEVQGVEVRAGGRPKLLGPEGSVLGEKLLSCFSSMGGGSILLKHLVSITSNLFHPRDQFFLQDVDIACRIEPISSIKEH